MYFRRSVPSRKPGITMNMITPQMPINLKKEEPKKEEPKKEEPKEEEPKKEEPKEEEPKKKEEPKPSAWKTIPKKKKKKKIVFN